MDFVSNSSSTSFTCEICGNSETFYDGCSPSDYGFYTCVNRHDICEECLDATETVWDDYYGYVIKKEDCPICRFEVIRDYDLVRYLKKVYSIAEEEVLQEIKKINKRRRRIYDQDYINYICQKFNLQVLTLVTKIKEEYKDYEAFWSFIR